VKCLDLQERLVAEALADDGAGADADLAGHAAACDDCAGVAAVARAAAGLLGPEAPAPAPAGEADGGWSRLRERIAADRRRLDLRIAVACSYCHDDLPRAEAVFCASCLAPHHEECFREHGLCSALGCDETLVVQAREAGRAPARRRRPWLAWAAAGLGGLAVAAAALGPPALAPEPRPAPAASTGTVELRHVATWADGSGVRVDADDAATAAVLRELALVAGRELRVDGELSGRVTLRRERIAWRAALEQVAAAVGAGVEVRPDAVVVAPGARAVVLRSGAGRVDVVAEDHPAGEALEAIAAAVGRELELSGPIEGTVTATMRSAPWRQAAERVAAQAGCELEELPSGGLRVTQPPRVSLYYEDADVRTVIQDLVARGGADVVIHPEVRGRVTMDLTGVHWLRALDAVVRTTGDFVIVEESDDLLRIAPVDAIEEQLDTVVLPLAHRDPTTLRPVLLEALARKGLEEADVAADPATHSLVVTGSRPTLAAVRDLLERLDVPPPPGEPRGE